MNIGMYLGAAAMGALERWQESISQNIASGSTPGYRKRETEFSMQPTAGKTDTATGMQPAMFPSSRVEISFQPGQINSTGRDLDFAIQGKGFFEVQTPDGGKAYTRAGSFYANSDRTLTDAEGRPVSGEGGAPITLLPEGGPVVVSRDGTVSQGKQIVGKLAVYEFANNQSLDAVSGGLFVPTDGQTATSVERPELLQGALESSNVQPLREMVDLIQVSKAYAAAQKVVTSRDDTMDKTIRALT